MVNVQANFPSKYQNNLNCPLCETHDQLNMECKELTTRLKTGEISMTKIVYGDIFSDVQKQKEIDDYSQEPKATGRNRDLTVPWQLIVVEVT